jgi:hypothetical protein
MALKKLNQFKNIVYGISLFSSLIFSANSFGNLNTNFRVNAESGLEKEVSVNFPSRDFYRQENVSENFSLLEDIFDFKKENNQIVQDGAKLELMQEYPNKSNNLKLPFFDLDEQNVKDVGGYVSLNDFNVYEEKKKKNKESGCYNNLIVLKENYERELIKPTNNRVKWGFNEKNIVKEIKEINPIKYDFLVIIPTIEGNTDNQLGFSFSPRNINIKGIGQNEYNSLYLTDVKGIITLSLNKVGWFGQKAFSEYLFMPVLHEISHYWLAEVKGFYRDNLEKSMTGHYIRNIDLFYGKPDVEINSGQRWYYDEEDDEIKFVSSGSLDFKGEIKFSDLSLYLMGLIPPDEVKPIKVFDYEGEQYFAGPGPHTNPVWTEIREVSIEDIIEANGERIPSYKDSQKDFSAVFVVVVPYGEKIPEGYLDYVEKFRALTSKMWYEKTGFRSKMQTNFCNE